MIEILVDSSSVTDYLGSPYNMLLCIELQDDDMLYCICSQTCTLWRKGSCPKVLPESPRTILSLSCKAWSSRRQIMPCQPSRFDIFVPRHELKSFHIVQCCWSAGLIDLFLSALSDCWMYTLSSCCFAYGVFLIGGRHLLPWLPD